MGEKIWTTTTSVFSPCRKWRYQLARTWDTDLSECLFIGLNPSTADEQKDDPTVRRCVRFARDWGYGGLIMTNIFGYRATNPTEMKVQEDPVGPDNDIWLVRSVLRAGRVICAWGNHGEYAHRGQIVHNMLKKYFLECLGITRSGEPKHPLYLPKTTPIRRYYGKSVY